MLRRQRLAMRGPQKYPYQIHLDPALVLFLQMNEGAGIKALDSSIFGNHGTMYNTPLWKTGVRDRGLEFNGTTQYIKCADSASLKVTKAATLQAWINLDNRDTYSTIFAKYSAAAGSAYWLQLTVADKYLRTNLAGTTGGILNDDTTEIALDTWYLATLTYDGVKTRLWLNDVNIKSEDSTGNITANNADLQISGYDGTNKIWDGYFDEIRIYNRALDAQEILDIYERTKPQS